MSWQRNVKRRGRMQLRYQQRGWGMAEYVAVLLGLAAVFEIFDLVRELIREHHAEFSWALMLPF